MDAEKEKRFRFRMRYEQEQAQSQQPQQQGQPDTSLDLASTLYHGVIEGGAMTLGGAAGAVLGAPGGPVVSGLAGVGLAASMYPPAKRFAEGIDRFRGITPHPAENPAKEFGTGLAIEAGGKVLGPIAKGVGKLLPGAKTGEMLSGTPASNLKRAYKQGFTETYLKPKPLAEVSDAYGEAKFDMVKNTITPEEQVAMLVNPRGEANQKVSDVMLKWLRGEKVSANEALAAREGIDTIFPPDTARKQVQRGGLSDFRTAMNDVLANERPEFKQASNEFAKSKLRSQLLKPARVNRTNPDQYSGLGGMFNILGAGIGYGTGNLPLALGATVGTSPLAMGLTSSLAGSTAQIASKVKIPETVRRAALAAFIDKVTTGKQ